MPSKVYNNVEDHRLIYESGNEKFTVEDVTSVTIPTVEHPTVDIDAAGLAGVISMPNSVKVNAMEFTVSHNNGANCEKLINGGKNVIEFRLVRQKYDVALGEIQHESVKYRLTVVHKSTDDGTVQTGNPLGSSDKFSVLRYEKYVGNGADANLVILIDVMTGQIQLNGKELTDDVQTLLN